MPESSIFRFSYSSKTFELKCPRTYDELSKSMIINALRSFTQETLRADPKPTLVAEFAGILQRIVDVSEVEIARSMQQHTRTSFGNAAFGLHLHNNNALTIYQRIIEEAKIKLAEVHNPNIERLKHGS